MAQHRSGPLRREEGLSFREWLHIKRIQWQKARKRVWRRFRDAGHGSISLMFIPHGVEQKVYTLRVSKFVLVFLFLLFTGTVLFTIQALSDETTSPAQIAELSNASSVRDVQFLLFSYTSKTTAENVLPFLRQLKMLGVSFGVQDLRGYFPEASTHEPVPEEIRSRYGPNFHYTEELVKLGQLNEALGRTTALLKRINHFLATYKPAMRAIPSGWPVLGGGLVTSPYGYRVNPISGGYALHTGVDIALAQGVRIRCTAPGRVITSDEDGGYGLSVVVRHAYGFRTRYAHLETVQIAEDFPVRRGQIIGTMGDSGNATGYHLHYEVLINGKYVDPVPFLRNLLY